MLNTRTERACIAWFITPHGLGHASRAAAIMEALQSRAPSIELHIFTTVPQAFFRESLTQPFAYHSVVTDVGLVQSTSLREDLSASAVRLAAFIPFDSHLVAALARELVTHRCRLVVVDIAPLGLAAARQAGIPSVLIENFTWDWIYEGYAEQTDLLQPYVEYLRKQFDGADHHIQTTPVCQPDATARVVSPVSRSPRLGRIETRRRLGLPAEVRTVLVSMGGIPEACRCEERLAAIEDAAFLVPGTGNRLERRGNVFFIPFHAGLYHPDLVHACDAVVGKVGYSTMAEVYYAGLPFAYVRRRHFREAKTLCAFITRQFHGIGLDVETFENGSWTERVRQLLTMPRTVRTEPNGSQAAAGYLCDFL